VDNQDLVRKIYEEKSIRREPIAAKTASGVTSNCGAIFAERSQNAGAAASEAVARALS